MRYLIHIPVVDLYDYRIREVSVNQAIRFVIKNRHSEDWEVYLQRSKGEVVAACESVVLDETVWIVQRLNTYETKSKKFLSSKDLELLKEDVTF